MGLLIAENMIVDGFEFVYGWFSRKCTICGEKTKERIRHRQPFEYCKENIGYWSEEPQHFSCHLAHCPHSFCKKHAPDFEKIQMERMRDKLVTSGKVFADV